MHPPYKQKMIVMAVNWIVSDLRRAGWEFDERDIS
jgi:hypothetical protein